MVRPEKHYEVLDIAEEFGHMDYYTPPSMHCFASSKSLLAVGKNPIERLSVNSMTELEEKMHANFHGISFETIVRAYADHR